MINLLFGFGVSVPYARLLRLEGRILNVVLHRTAVNEALYIPPDEDIAYADFTEDTPDRKRTLHATVMAIYQRCPPAAEVPVQRLELPGEETSAAQDLLKKLTKVLECSQSADKPTSRTCICLFHTER